METTRVPLSMMSAPAQAMVKGATNATRFASPDGVFDGVGSANADNGVQLLTGQFTGVNFKASKQVPTATENRPYHATITVCIRMKTFSPVMN